MHLQNWSAHHHHQMYFVIYTPWLRFFGIFSLSAKRLYVSWWGSFNVGRPCQVVITVAVFPSLGLGAF